ncbi:MAG: BamA/TamA family outer membrane protein [Woeseia sp.]
MIGRAATGAWLTAIFLAAAVAAHANEVRYSISGVSEPLLTNVRNHIQEFGITGSARVTPAQFQNIVDDAKASAAAALKPYGYYHPNITTKLVDLGGDVWRLEVRIEPGPAVRVQEATVRLRGEGADQEDLRKWREDWPLREGAILNQSMWRQQKEDALALAEAEGYLNARFVTHSIEIDLIRNEAKLALVLDTGLQAEFGDIIFRQDVVKPYVLENVPRFSKGSGYRPDLVDSLRLDLWAAGYFTDIEVEEQRWLERSPPVVDLVATLKTETKNTYQGSLGTGTDTGFRTQAMWSRSPLSSRGDRLDVGIGYQQMDDEFTSRADYRVPRDTDERQFWVSNLTLRRDKQDLEVKRNEDDENFINLASGNVEDVFFRVGRLQVRDRDLGRIRYFETIFAQYLRESYTYNPGTDADPAILELVRDEEFGSIFRDTVSTVAIGLEWDWPAVTGSGFGIFGHHERAWIFTSSDLWGSARQFTQIYLSSRRSFVRAENWKLLLRGEIGYTDAKVDELKPVVGGQPLPLSLTRLPSQYRFKAGGSDSVRGHGFEDLSNNDVGSNNIITASVEIERKFLQSWSAAVFVDAGNAFNNWSDFDIRTGAGVGLRWYTIAGAIRLDVARALDIEGRPWRVHFTLGTPLL